MYSLFAAEGGWQDFTLKGGEWAVLLLSVAAALLALGVGFFLVKKVLSEDEGSPKMREIAAATRRTARRRCRSVKPVCGALWRSCSAVSPRVSPATSG